MNPSLLLGIIIGMGAVLFSFGVFLALPARRVKNSNKDFNDKSLAELVERNAIGHDQRAALWTIAGHLAPKDARGVQLGCAAALRATLENTATKDVTGALRNEIVAELKAASGAGPAIVLEPMEFKLEVVEPPATPEETKAILDETLEQIRRQP